MKAQVQKWGNSLALRIPESIVLKAGLAENSSVDLSLADGRILISPLQKPQITLESLLLLINEGNLHDEVDTGPSVGREEWCS